MTTRRFAAFLCLVVTGSVLSTILASGVQAQERTRIGLKMYHAEFGKLLYEAERTIERADGRATERTVYSKSGGAAIQESETVYEQASLKLISHSMKDMRLGLEEKVSVSGGNVNIAYREETGDEMETEQIDWWDNMIIAATIMPLLRRNWAKIATGEEVVFQLIVVSRQGTVTFRLRKNSTAEVNGEPATVVVMEPDSFFIRALVNPMVFTVADAHGHNLLKFAGRTSVKTDDGSNQDLRVEYSY